jgi:hypothetical protein
VGLVDNGEVNQNLPGSFPQTRPETLGLKTLWRAKGKKRVSAGKPLEGRLGTASRKREPIQRLDAINPIIPQPAGLVIDQ